MPVYLVSNNCNNNNCNNEKSFCRDTSSFFSKLATKLMDMAVTINKRIEKIKSEVKSSSGGGVLLASIETPVMMLGIKVEYMEYIRRYGPPEGGKFDEGKLEIIKNELGISVENTL